MTVRPMSERDVEQAAGLSAQLGYPVESARLMERFRKVASDTDAEILVAESPAGALAGWVHVCGRRSLEADAHAEIAGLVVDASRRRQGIGRGLVEAAETWAREHGYPRLRVRSNVTRDGAHDFYPGIGFARLKTQHVYERVVAKQAG